MHHTYFSYILKYFKPINIKGFQYATQNMRPEISNSFLEYNKSTQTLNESNAQLKYLFYH